jgi:hypothetical protein
VHQPDAHSAVLAILRNEEDQADLVGWLGQKESYLSGWSTSFHELGFVLHLPLVAGYVLEARGLKEWSPDHELANRVGQLLVLRRFGELPAWLQLGIGWAGEWSARHSIYCFPYRSEFVYAAEHDAWPGDVAREAKQGPLPFEALARWRRGSYEPALARVAFGLASWLAAQEPAKVSAALRALQERRERQSRKEKPDGTWERDTGYELPPAEQLETLEHELGPQLLERAGKWLQDPAFAR